MMGWINTTIDFPDRRTVLLVGRRDFIFRELESLTRKLTDPLEIELRLRALLNVYRPDLSGCSILWMDFRFDRAEWEIGIEHPSIDPVARGCMCSRQRLIRELDCDEDFAEMLPVTEVTGAPIEEHEPPADSVLVPITRSQLIGDMP